MTPKRISTNRIALLTGVSRKTVTRILKNLPTPDISPETRQKILDAVRATPTQTTPRSNTNRRGVIALVIRMSKHQLVDDALVTTVIQGVTAAVQKQKYQVIVEPVAPTGASLFDVLRHHDADGLILSGPCIGDEELIQLQESTIPLVLIGMLPSRSIPSVDVDNIRGARSAVAHLISLGHQRIACITNASLKYTASRDRLTGYRAELVAAGLEYDGRLVRCGEFTDESGARAMHDLLEHVGPPPTAVFVASDVVALGTISAIHDAGLRVPEDIAVVGFDDIPLAKFIDPPLTTVQLPAHGLGWSAGDLLARLIEAPDQVRQSHLILETKLIVRRSTVPLL